MCSPDSRTVTCVRSSPAAFPTSACVLSPALCLREKYFLRKFSTRFSSRRRSLRYSRSSAASLSSHSSTVSVGSSMGSFRTISSSVRRIFLRSSGSVSRLYSKHSSMIAAIRCFSSELVCEAARVPVLLSILRKPDFKSEWRARTALPKDVSATISRISIVKGSRFYDFFPLFPTFHHFVTPFFHFLIAGECASARLLRVRRLDLEGRVRRGRLWPESIG